MPDTTLAPTVHGLSVLGFAQMTRGSILEPMNEKMSVSEAVNARKSIRAFLDTPIDDDLIREVLAKAARAPSGGNVQPWRVYVLNGDTT